ncbi:GNT-I family domain-containing protein [Ditylenchus destructor]|nr:GNT-I family domain-containing protein [Ditylenchus destructor]
MNFLRRGIALFAAVFCVFLLVSLRIAWVTHYETLSDDYNIRFLSREIRELENIVQNQKKDLDLKSLKIDRVLRASRIQLQEPQSNPTSDKFTISVWNEPIPILVFVCNRAEALKYQLGKLLTYRTSEESFPIFISQDCDNREVKETVKQYGTKLHYIKHISSETARIRIPAEHRRYAMYYKISRHYKLGLTHIFDVLNHTSVIILEDDLDIASDFFEYFMATRKILDTDKSLYCVSAWNDNGKPNLINANASTLLYRSDFFSGLGWMMTRDLWTEIGKKWPPGFWDDWIREPEQRLGRACIRPEVSRTAMTQYGKIGASKGLFFNKHLKLIALNQIPANFSRMDLGYLQKSVYDADFQNNVHALPAVSVDEFMRKAVEIEMTNESRKITEYRIEYSSMKEFTDIAFKLQIMTDTKAGVPRTAYIGIVSCYINNIRVFVAPKDLKTWAGYDRHWSPPFDPSEIKR